MMHYPCRHQNEVNHDEKRTTAPRRSIAVQEPLHDPELVICGLIWAKSAGACAVWRGEVPILPSWLDVDTVDTVDAVDAVDTVDMDHSGRDG